VAALLVPPIAWASGSVADMVDSARAEEGLGALAYNEGLAGIAEAHSASMRDTGTIFHNSSLGSEVSSSGMRWRLLGENVGMGFDVEHVEQAFMESAEHHQNIMDARFNAIGVGVAQDSGHVYVTQVFARLEVAAPPSMSRAQDSGSAPVSAVAAARPVVRTIQTVAAEPNRSNDPPGFTRAEDESMVPVSYYAQQMCSGQGWVGSTFPGTSSVASSSFLEDWC
jgi:hypothetical protein